MIKDDGGPAYPVADIPENYKDMSLRDAIAIGAMQSMLAFTTDNGRYQSVGVLDSVSAFAYRMADSMLKERAK